MNQQARNLLQSSETMISGLNDMMKDLEGMVLQNIKKLSPKEKELLVQQFENSKLFDLANKVRETCKEVGKQ